MSSEGKQVVVTLELPPLQAEALAQFVKRVGWHEFRQNAVDDGVVSRNPRKFCRKRSQAKFPAAETIRHGLSRMFWLCKPGISANGVPVP